MRFVPTVAGTVTALRFYKGPNNTGTHTGVLWSTSGTRLAQGTFTDESAAGWQTLTLAQPVAVSAGTEYVASYRTTAGRYSATPGQFSSEYNRPPLRVPRNGGAYSYADAYPGNTSGASYLVDVVLERGPAEISVAAREPAPGAAAVPRWSPVRIRLSAPLVGGWDLAVTRQSDGSALPGSSVLDAAGTSVTFTPSSALPADVDVRARLTGAVSTDGAVLPAQTWTFRTRAADPVTAQTLFSDHVPRNLATTDAAAVEVGTAFRVTKPGSVTAIRFHKGPGNTGTHTGSLWTSTGTRLASVIFTDESATGWQGAALSTPVPLTPGELYVVSYLAPNGRYSSTPGFFSGPFTSGDLTAPAQQNGRFRYGAGGGFPTNDHGATNYFVDVVFAPTPVSVSVTGRTPSPGATGVSRGARPTITLSAPVADGYAMSILQGSTGLPATLTRSADGRTLTLAPSSLLPGDTDLTVSVTGVVSAEGAVLPEQTWTFRTEAATPDGASLFAGLVPPVPAASDSGSVELGTVFTPAVDGAVTQVRFYKGTGNGGTHVGSLWTASGTRLASVTFTGESATGWQTATFTTPVPVGAGQTYVVSYLAPQGRYPVGAGFFATAWTAGQLSAPAGQNGRYLYGAAGGFPTGSHNSSSYYVDVTFRAATSSTSGIAAPTSRASAAGRVEYVQGPDAGSDRGTRDDDERATTRLAGSGATAAGSSGRSRVLGAEPGPQLPVQRRVGAGRRLRPGPRPRRGPR
ncbi:DUF4082 domain-containing protein [Nocardioides dongxiaopingii]|uniref:DUF4082 domain-containing protein n=1 Tax=Nocardioides sp. S-1144 TaxID=2582905 RepID=UPI00267B86C3|nr:DUF4082 domain-containing protein [Nocardioides sp. S-1144]